MKYVLLVLISYCSVTIALPLKKTPCGLNGSIQERLKGCSRQVDALQGNFQLVSRNIEMNEVRLDLISGLIWSYELKSPMDHYNADIACSDNSYSEINHALNLDASIQWKLPNVEEYRVAASHNIDSILGNVEVTYWTSNITSNIHYRAFVFHLRVDDGKYFSIEDEYRMNETVRVRCVTNNFTYL